MRGPSQGKGTEERKRGKREKGRMGTKHGHGHCTPGKMGAKTWLPTKPKTVEKWVLLLANDTFAWGVISSTPRFARRSYMGVPLHVL